MTNKPDSPRVRRSDTSLSMENASKLLRIGAIGPRRPVDDLVDRLAQPDGAQWLPAALTAGPLSGSNLTVVALTDGGATLEQLDALKDRSKVLMRKTTSEDDKLAAAAGYFVAIAAGLRHHQRLLTHRGRSEVDQACLDLAEFAPEPFSEMFCAATLADAN